MAKTSPTQRSLQLMRDRGCLAEVVERWNPHSRTRHDLWGFVDIICLDDNQVIAVQSTSRSNMSARIRKIEEHENLAAVLRAGIQIVVHGWKKDKAGKWLVDEFTF
jgi:hypothetical protein